MNFENFQNELMSYELLLESLPVDQPSFAMVVAKFGSYKKQTRSSFPNCFNHQHQSSPSQSSPRHNHYPVHLS